jgi:hypothetical protein
MCFCSMLALGGRGRPQLPPQPPVLLLLLPPLPPPPPPPPPPPLLLGETGELMVVDAHAGI